MKFICDQMLGTLAKWLRIYGFDTFYANGKISDEELIRIAKEEKRILITRDKTLAKVGKRENIKIIEINDTNLDNQIKMVLKDKNIEDDAILSRCLICNSTIEEIEKEKVKGKVPDRVYRSNDEFWFCKNCNKIYWKGTHYINMLKRIKS